MLWANLICAFIPSTLAIIAKTDQICIVGAGASGVMTARQLVQKGYTAIAIIEKNGYIGGKAYNFVDPAGYVHPMGPEGGWNGYNLVMDLLGRHGVAYYNETAQMKTVFFESQTGTMIANPPPTDPTAFTTAYNKYLTLRASYAAYLVNGYTSGGAIPAALSAPFSTFITNNQLTPLLPVLYASVVSYGYGSFNTFPTLYALKTLTPGKMKLAIDKSTAFRTDYQQLIERMALYLTNVQITLNAQITSMTRTATGVTLNYSVRGVGQTKNCKVLINAFAPTVSAMSTFGLDATETNVFSNVFVQQYASHVGYLPAAIERNSIYFGNLAYDSTKNPQVFVAEPKSDMRPIAIKKFNMNSDYAIVFNWAGVSPAQTAATMASTLQTYLAGPLSGKFPATIDFSMKHEYSPQVSTAAIQAGFFTNLKNLQGYRSTYYLSALTSFELVEDVFQGAIDFVTTYF